MENNLIELNDKAKEILNFVVSDIQNNCLKSEFGKAINSGIDIGIRYIFPDYIENQIINLKNNIYNYGVKDGLSKTMDEAISYGKSAIGIFTNNFEDISQAQMAIEKGGTIDKISELLDDGINNLKNSKKIDSSTAKTLKSEKNTILKNIEENIENSFSNQIKNTENLEKNISNWKDYYENRNFSGMEKEYNKMKKILDSMMPTEKILKEYNYIENLQNLIKNNGNNFDLSQEEIDLFDKLIN